MKVFAHWYNSETSGNDYRWGTILQFGTSWDIIGSVVMKNPGSAEPLNSVHERTTLEYLKRFSNEPKDCWQSSVWYSFSSDDTMLKIERLFCAYYKVPILNGVIQVFNLMNVRDPNLELALIKNNGESLPFSKTTESDIKFLVAPVYIGWGDLWKKQAFREDAEKIFTAVKNRFDGNYLFPQLADNKFYHPQYLLGRGTNSPTSRFILNSFCQNTTTPILENQIMPRKQISKRVVFEEVVKRLRKDFKLVEEQSKTCRFQFTEELVLTITCTGHGYIGIRHAANAGRYCMGFYGHITEYRTILAEFGYNISHEVWLGTKDYTEYDGDESTIANSILSEVTTIRKKI